MYVNDIDRDGTRVPMVRQTRQRAYLSVGSQGAGGRTAAGPTGASEDRRVCYFNTESAPSC